MNENEKNIFYIDLKTLHNAAEISYSYVNQRDWNNSSHGEILRKIAERVEKSCESHPWFIRIKGKFQETLTNLIDHKIKALNDNPK